MKAFINAVTFIVCVLVVIFIVIPVCVLVLQEPADTSRYCASAVFGTILLSPVFFGTMLLRAIFCRKKNK